MTPKDKLNKWTLIVPLIASIIAIVSCFLPALSITFSFTNGLSATIRATFNMFTYSGDIAYEQSLSEWLVDVGRSEFNVIVLVPGIIIGCIFIYLSVKVLYKALSLMAGKNNFIKKDKFWIKHGFYFIIAGIVFLIVWEIFYQVIKVLIFSNKVVNPPLLLAGGMGFGVGLILEFVVGCLIIITQLIIGLATTREKAVSEKVEVTKKAEDLKKVESKSEQDNKKLEPNGVEDKTELVEKESDLKNIKKNEQN